MGADSDDRTENDMAAIPPDAHVIDTGGEESVMRGHVEDGLRFLNRQLTAQGLVNAELTATLKAVVETLITTGALPQERFEERRERALDRSTEELREKRVLRIAEAVDKYAIEKLPDVPCAELMPICGARCCKLDVYLSPQDLDEKVFLWDYGKPYQIRKGPSGHCVHSEAESHRCTVYGRRPAICREYDCRKDRRIWRDYEKRILATDPEDQPARTV